MFDAGATVYRDTACRAPTSTRWLSVVEATRVAQGVEWDGGRAEANSPSTNSGTAEPAGAQPEGPSGPEGHAHMIL